MRSVVLPEDAFKVDELATSSGSPVFTKTPPPSQAPAATLQRSPSFSQPGIELPEGPCQPPIDPPDPLGAATETSSVCEPSDSPSFAIERGFMQAMQSLPGFPNPVDIDSADASDLRALAVKLLATAAETRAAVSLSEVQNEMSRMVNEDAARRAVVDKQLSERNLELLRGVTGPAIPHSQSSQLSLDISETEARLRDSLRRISELESYVQSLQERVEHGNRVIRECCYERDSLRDENRALKKHIIDNRTHADWLFSDSQTGLSHTQQSSQTSVLRTNACPPLSQSASQRSGSDYEGLDIILAAANSSDHGMSFNGSHFNHHHQRLSQQTVDGFYHPSVPQERHSLDKFALFTQQPASSASPPPSQMTQLNVLSRDSFMNHHSDDATVAGSDAGDDESFDHGYDVSGGPHQSPITEKRISWLRQRTSESKKRTHQSRLHQYSRIDKPGVTSKKKRTSEHM